MSEKDSIENKWIYGIFSSSFSTEIVREIDNPSITLREINLEGRKFVNNCVFGDANFIPAKESLVLKDRFIGNAELFPDEGQNYPLDTPRKFNLVDTRIFNVSISHEQKIDGVIHGKIEGEIFGRVQKIIKEEKTKEIESIKNNISPYKKTTETSNIEEIEPNNLKDEHRNTVTNDFNQLRSNDIEIAEPIGQDIKRGKGCLPSLRTGCGGLIGLLILLWLLSFLFRKCSSDNLDENYTEDTQLEQQGSEDDSSGFNYVDGNSDDESFEDDYFESDADSSVILDDKTVHEYRTVSLPQVQFFTNDDSLLPSSEAELDKLAIYLLEHLQLKARIIGHTDNKGDDEKNRILSAKRANTVKMYLENQGVESERLKSVGKGEAEPKASNETEEGRLMNRRVEVEIIEKVFTETDN